MFTLLLTVLLLSSIALMTNGDVNTTINSAVAHVNANSSNFCCEALAFALGSKVSFPNTTPYNLSLSSYFSLQEADQSPGCIVTPSNTEDVSISVGVLSVLSKISNGSLWCKFAIRSGGHAAWAGQANIDLGVTLDLSSLDAVEVTENNTITSVGPGARWEIVYLLLDSLGLAVAGGRAAQVGVGGLSTGGGISYFSPRQGFTCDNVKNFEVVVANGQILNANANENPDLWVALRGGSNNFGVITRLDLITFEQGDMWGGEILYVLDTVPQQISALVDFANNVDYDEFASLIVSFGFAAGQGPAVENSFAYTKPVVNPAVFRSFTSIPNLESTARISNLTNFAIEQGAFQPDGFRQLTITTTFKITEEIITAAFNLWNESLAEIGSITNLVWSLSLDPIPPALSLKSSSMGGDVLGIDPKNGAVIIAELTATWTSADDDNVVINSAKAMFSAIESKAISLGAYDAFKYLNYAANFQDPIDGYGAENKAKLQAVSRKYDPAGIFQKGVPGGFKLFN